MKKLHVMLLIIIGVICACEDEYNSLYDADDRLGDNRRQYIKPPSYYDSVVVSGKVTGYYTGLPVDSVPVLLLQTIDYENYLVSYSNTDSLGNYTIKAYKKVQKTGSMPYISIEYPADYYSNNSKYELDSLVDSIDIQLKKYSVLSLTVNNSNLNFYNILDVWNATHHTITSFADTNTFYLSGMYAEETTQVEIQANGSLIYYGSVYAGGDDTVSLIIYL
jgi:hypothetical protein